VPALKIQFKVGVCREEKDWESSPKNMRLACRAECEEEEGLLQEKETCVWWL